MAVKTNKIDWKRMRELQITTDSLWITNTSFPYNRPIFILPKRLNLPKPSKSFHGIWISEIPYQFITRFTNENDNVWSVFAGSGVDKKVADMLNRKCIETDLNPRNETTIKCDVRYVDIKKRIKLALIHPPYHNIVRYSDNPADGSNCENIEIFLKWFNQVIKNVNRFIDTKGIIILCVGNIYSQQEEHTLGVWCKDIVRKYGYKCKAHIVKDYGETKGSSAKNYNLNYYRQLRGSYNNFYGDNIFILQKVK